MIEFSTKRIGPGEPTFIVAEMSGNHNQSFDEAVKLVRLAKESGADAIKVQTYTPDTMTIDCDADVFKIGVGTIWEGMTLHQLYQQAYTPWEWQPKLKELADELGLVFFSTPFDTSAVDFLEHLEVGGYKIASFELIDHELLRKVAATGKPIILSTGMGSMGEIEESVKVVRDSGCEDLVILKCTSSYPAVPDQAHVRTIPHLAEAFQVPVGLSDHTLGIAVPIAAVALGACVIEKHFIESRNNEGPDSKFSLEPAEWRQMVDAVRIAEKALGRVNYDLTENEKASTVFRRSLFVVADVKAGETFSRENVRCIRPGVGLAPKFLPEVLGRTAKRDLKRGTPVDWSVIG